MALGGHSVPEIDVRRRYTRSLSHLREVMSIADETIVYDNSGPEPRLILEIRSGSIVCNAGEPPPWARNLLEDVHL